MSRGRFVAYYRVSTERQGRSGLGLEAQQAAVRGFLDGGHWQLVAEYTEVESGRRNDRPELSAALAACRVHRATLVIARIDRLSRNAAFLMSLQDAGVKFVCVDMPDANETTVGLMAVMAQHVRKTISESTRAALAAAKARGVRLGTPANLSPQARGAGSAAGVAARRRAAAQRAADLAPTLAALRAAGARTLRGLADRLNQQGVPAPRGGKWTAAQVRRLELSR
jgi:DNA invertase Pin-like site-specific DNA recombinase